MGRLNSKMHNGGNMYRYSRLLRSLRRWFAVSCAQSNGDINRVQPNVVKKTDLLDGVWYFRNTVTYVPADHRLHDHRRDRQIEKIVFEIQENSGRLPRVPVHAGRRSDRGNNCPASR